MTEVGREVSRRAEAEEEVWVVGIKFADQPEGGRVGDVHPHHGIEVNEVIEPTERSLQVVVGDQPSSDARR